MNCKASSKRLQVGISVPTKPDPDFFRFPPEPPRAVVEVKDVQKQQDELEEGEVEADEGETTPDTSLASPPSDSESFSSCSSGEEGSSDSDEGSSDQAPTKKSRGQRPPNAEAQVWWVHRRSKMLHLVKGQENMSVEVQVFECGRSVSDTCRPAEEADAEGHVCSTCRKNM